MFGTKPTFSLVAFCVASTWQTAGAVTTANADSSYRALQSWYNQSTGLWIPSTVSRPRTPFTAQHADQEVGVVELRQLYVCMRSPHLTVLR